MVPAMATCDHCGTAFSPASTEDRYCCRGCEFVASMIRDSGFDRFYDLKQGLATTPVRSRPFEEHDFAWAAEAAAAAESRSSDGTAWLDLSLEGVSCVGCVWLIEKLFEKSPGAIRAAAHPASGRLHLEWQSGRTDVPGFLRELTRYGYVATPTPASTPDHERRRLAARLGLCGAFALNAMGFSLPAYLGMPDDFEFARLFRLVAFLSATLAMLVGGAYFIDRAWRALRHRTLHIDLPIALGLISAYLGSIAGWAMGETSLHYFDFVATFVFLMLAGRYLQTAAVDRNRRRLHRSSPLPAEVETTAGPLTLDAIVPGTTFTLAPGRALPVAATVTHAAEAEVSLEWINGEADPVVAHPGSRLPAGAILLSRTPLTLTATETWRDSLLARLTRQDATERAHPKLQRLLRTYLLVVLLLGLAGFAFWAASGETARGLQVMISVFVVSCPCALGVAIPLADELANSRAAREGAFVRSTTLWARLLNVRHVVFDKTGTLTLERPVLIDPAAVHGLDDEAALALARLTSRSLHPVSRTLLESLGTRGQRLLASAPAPEVEETPGFGVSFLSPSHGRWTLGRAGWAGDPADGSTALCRDGRRIAAFNFRDSLRPGAPVAIEKLRQLGLLPWILSGDAPNKVHRLARLLHLPEPHATGGLRPEEKEERVRQLDRHNTLYLGDGANDSLAFDAAHVTGTPVVDRSLLESKADFYSLGASLDFLPSLFVIARTRALSVRTAFGFALLYNANAVSLCLAGHMSPLLAAILMPASSVISILLVSLQNRPQPSRQKPAAPPPAPHSLHPQPA